MSRWIRSHVVVSLAAVVVLALAVATPATALSPERAKSAGAVTPYAGTTPWIKSGYKNGPVNVPANYGRVAGMSLPAGSYVVMAKLWFHNEGTTLLSDCQLVVGSDVDVVETETATVAHEPIALMVASTLAAPGQVVLNCRDGKAGGGVTANWIKITAIRAGTWKNVALP